MQDFCNKLTEAIQQAPTSEVATELSKILSRCKANTDGEGIQPEASTLDSGGGGNTNPPEPGTKPTRPK